MGLTREWLLEDRKNTEDGPSRWAITRKDIQPHQEGIVQTSKIAHSMGWSTSIVQKYKEMYDAE